MAQAASTITHSSTFDLKLCLRPLNKVLTPFTHLEFYTILYMNSDVVLVSHTVFFCCFIYSKEVGIFGRRNELLFVGLLI